MRTANIVSKAVTLLCSKVAPWICQLRHYVFRGENSQTGENDGHGGKAQFERSSSSLRTRPCCSRGKQVVFLRMKLRRDGGTTFPGGSCLEQTLHEASQPVSPTNERTGRRRSFSSFLLNVLSRLAFSLSFERGCLLSFVRSCRVRRRPPRTTTTTHSLNSKLFRPNDSLE